MDTARYIVAVLVWIGLPPAIVHWLIIHPFVGFWRKRGKAVTLAVVAGLFIGVGVALYLIRDLVLVREFGTHWSLWVAAAGAYVMSMGIEIQCRKHLKFKTLAGVPELEADQSGRKLLDQGIYGRVRHPRYVGVTFGVLAMVLFANYLALWILWPVTIVSLYVIVLLEERELIASLGRVYEEYRERVPRFVPKGRQ